MTLSRIVAPGVPAISLNAAKAHLRVVHDTEDGLIVDLVEAATEFLERDTGLALIEQTWRFWCDDVPQDRAIRLQRYPAQSVIEVRAFDHSGQPKVLPPENYFLNKVARPPRLKLHGISAAHECNNGLEVDFVAGFGASDEQIPHALRRALLILLAHWYEFRGAFDAQDQPVSVPDAYRHLTSHYRGLALV